MRLCLRQRFAVLVDERRVLLKCREDASSNMQTVIWHFDEVGDRLFSVLRTIEITRGLCR